MGNFAWTPQILALKLCKRIKLIPWRKSRGRWNEEGWAMAANSRRKGRDAHPSMIGATILGAIVEFWGIKKGMGMALAACRACSIRTFRKHTGSGFPPFLNSLPFPSLPLQAFSKTPYYSPTSQLPIHSSSGWLSWGTSFLFEMSGIYMSRASREVILGNIFMWSLTKQGGGGDPSLLVTRGRPCLSVFIPQSLNLA